LKGITQGDSQGRENQIIKFMLLVKNASPQKDEQPTVQALTAHSAHLLSRLANDLLAAEPCEVSAGLRVIRDELRALSTAIRQLEPEESDITTVGAEVDRRRSRAETKEDYTLEEVMTELDRRWAQPSLPHQLGACARGESPKGH
jgi:hypothetical protein